MHRGQLEAVQGPILQAGAEQRQHGGRAEAQGGRRELREVMWAVWSPMEVA